MRNANSSRARSFLKGKSNSSSSCAWFVLFLVLGWILVLWWWLQNNHPDNSNILAEFNVESSLEVLNKTKNAIKSEWRQIKNTLHSDIDHIKKLKKTLQQPLVAPESTVHVETIQSISHTGKSGENSDMHIIFSTDCKPFMDYQTLVLFYSAVAVGQPGSVTRIVSGCTKEKEKQLTELYKKLFPNYHVHFTPDFSYDPVKKTHYVYFNKPYGLKHWLEHADPPVGPEAIVALLDPDMIFLRPITSQIRGLEGLIRKIPENELFDHIIRGRPAAAIYGLGAPWTAISHKHFNKKEICEPNSPCLNTTREYGEQHYSVGPPYVLHRDDMYRIATSWCRYAPKVHKQYPELLAEMYAYSIAAAHENLPHLQLSNYMVSNIYMNDEDEAWPLVDALPDVCQEPTADGKYYPGRPVPTLVHFCQTYRSGHMGWAKRRPQLLNIFTCESPLLLEPTKDLGTLDYKVVNGVTKKIGAKSAKRNAFVICTTHRTVNAAVTYYKQHMCDSKTANFSKTIKLEPVE